MASFDVSGKLIEKYDVQQITDTFKKREFVVECPKEINGNVYQDYLKFQLTQDRVSLIEAMNEGDMIKVHFNLRGSKYTSKKDGSTGYITNLECWRLESASAAPAAPSQQAAPAQAAPAPKTDAPVASSKDDSDLPF